MRPKTSPAASRKIALSKTRRRSSRRLRSNLSYSLGSCPCNGSKSRSMAFMAATRAAPRSALRGSLSNSLYRASGGNISARRFKKSALMSGRLGILPEAWSASICWQATSYRLAAWRRKMMPSTGMQYSEEVSLELARRLSAAAQRSDSNRLMVSKWFWFIDRKTCLDARWGTGEW